MTTGDQLVPASKASLIDRTRGYFLLVAATASYAQTLRPDRRTDAGRLPTGSRADVANTATLPA